MQVSTGELVEAESIADAIRKTGWDEDDIVMIRGNLVAVNEVSRRVKLSHAEDVRRKNRRKRQKASRRNNR